MNHPTGFEAKYPYRNHLRSMQGDKAMRRPHESNGRFSIGKLIAHDFGDGQLGNSLFNRRLQA